MYLRKLACVLFVLFSFTRAQTVADKKNAIKEIVERDGEEELTEEESKILSDGLSRMEHFERPLAKKFFATLMSDALTHEFAVKLKIAKNAEECYYEECGDGSELEARFQCLTPSGMRSSGKVRAMIRFPNGTIAMETKQPEKEGELNLSCTEEGAYEFCVINDVDSWTEKMVEYELHVFHHEQVAEFHLKHQVMDDDKRSSMYTLYDRLYQVLHDILLVRASIIHRKGLLQRDWFIVTENYDMVLEISIVLILIIMSLSYGQVYYLKRMFHIDVRPVNGNPTKL